MANFTVESLQTPEGVAELNAILDRVDRLFEKITADYSVSNLTQDRSYDADSTSVAELADVLGTLFQDIKDL